MELLKLLNTGEIIAQILGFLILFFILRIFFWKKFLKMLDERKEKISSGLKSIEENKKTIEELKSNYEKQLSAIEHIAQTKFDEALRQAHNESEVIKDQAQKAAQKIIDEARLTTKYELVKAKEELKNEIADLVLDATEHLLGEEVTEERDKRIVKDFLEKIAEK